MLKWFICAAPWFGTVAQWFSVLATLAAVVVALFKDQFFRWRNRPILKASIRLGAPDCAKTLLFLRYQESPVGRADCYYLRLWVENVGRGRAEDVQVYVAKLYKRKDAEGEFQPVESFLPMNLTWAHGQLGQPEVFARSLASGMGRHCDLGSVVDPKAGPPFYVATPDSPIGQCSLTLSVEAPPTTGNHILGAGTYLIELRIAGSNSARVTHFMQVSLDGRWFDDSEAMLSSGVAAQVLDRCPIQERA
jgi:hypothetical protein